MESSSCAWEWLWRQSIPCHQSCAPTICLECKRHKPVPELFWQCVKSDCLTLKCVHFCHQFWVCCVCAGVPGKTKPAGRTMSVSNQETVKLDKFWISELDFNGSRSPLFILFFFSVYLQLFMKINRDIATLT